ncbi:hypothetical protein ACPV5U_19115 [Vibrio mediterranei]
MNLVTNDAAGLFLLPLASKLAEDMWNVVNGLGLVFAPFVFLFVYTFFESRAQGLDEGSPAVLAIKSVEKLFYPWLIILIVVVMPVSSALNVEYRQYSCLDNPALTSNSNTSPTRASQTALAAMNLVSQSPSMLAGLVHTVSLGVNEALTSQIACTKGAGRKEVSEIVQSSIPQTESVYRSIVAFNNQCYLPAKTNIREAMATNTPLRYTQDNLNGWAFFPPSYDGNALLMTSAYDGSYLKGRSSSKISIDTPNTWYEQSTKNMTLDCKVAGQNLYDKIEADLVARPNFTDNAKKVLDYASIFNASLTHTQVKHDLVVAVYQNALSTQGSSQSKWLDMETERKKAGWSVFGLSLPSIDSQSSILDDMADYRNEDTDRSVMRSLTNTIVSVGSLATNIYESSKSHAVVLMLPLMVIIVQCILVVALPILTVISGYSYKFLFNWCLLYFSVSLVPFWLNFGMLMETLMLSMSDYSDSLTAHAMNLYQGGVDAYKPYLVSTTSSMFVYLIPIIWIMLVQIVGNVAGSAFMTIVAGAAVVGQQGAELVTQTINRSVEKAVDRAMANKEPNSVGMGGFGASSSSGSPSSGGPELGSNTHTRIGNS